VQIGGRVLLETDVKKEAVFSRANRRSLLREA